MKKIVFFISLIIITMAVSAQTATPDQPISETERIVDKYLDRAEDAISALAEKLSVPAEHVYEVLLRQQMVEAVAITIVLVLMAISSYLLISIPYKDWRRVNIAYNKKNDITRENYNYYDLSDSWWVWPVGIGIVLGVITVIAILSAIGPVATGFINPEYGAVQEILKVIQ